VLYKMRPGNGAHFAVSDLRPSSLSGIRLSLAHSAIYLLANLFLEPHLALTTLVAGHAKDLWRSLRFDKRGLLAFDSSHLRGWGYRIRIRIRNPGAPNSPVRIYLPGVAN
jgi:hypothetical protein